jgi:hypothetical protein
MAVLASASHSLVLYATTGCHLCEQAQQLIIRVLGAPVHEVDIAENELLMTDYAEHIPVLHRLDTGAEIRWPFAAEDIQRLCHFDPVSLGLTHDEDLRSS